MNDPSSINLSIVVPVYNEEGNVESVHQQIYSVLKRVNKSFEIIFVDDGSIDKTLDTLKQLRPITIVCLNKHYGQSYALDAGIKKAKGNIIVTLDGDGQNDPEDIPLLLSKMEEGYDVVCGWRYKRKDSLSKRIIAQGANLLRKFLVKDDIHDAGCTLRVYRHQCFHNLDIYEGMHRMLPAILRWQGFKLTEIKVRHHPRLKGTTKYGLWRIFHGLYGMITIALWRHNPQQPLYFGKRKEYSATTITQI